MPNVIPYDFRSRRIREIAMHPDTHAITVQFTPPAPAGYFQALGAHTGVTIYTMPQIPERKAFVVTRDGGRRYEDLYV